MPGQLFGGGGGGTTSQPTANNPSVFLPPNQPQASQGWNSLLQGLFSPAMATLQQGYPNPAQTAYPQVLQAAQQMYANPYAQQGQDTSGYASNFFTNSAFPAQYGAGSALQSSAMGLLPEMAAQGKAIGIASADPQGALFNQLMNQNQQQSQAANAAAGVFGPYAASTADQSAQNFAMNWQNQELQRLLSGGQGLSNLGAGMNMAGSALGQGAQQQTGALQNYANFGQLPYQTSIGQAQNDFGGTGNLINQGGQMYALPQQVISDLANYMGLGQQASLYSGQLGQLGQPNLGAIGALGGLGSNFLLGNQGLFGALGVNPQTGLIGSLFGGGGAGSLLGGGSVAEGSALSDIFSTLGTAGLFAFA